MPSEVEWVGDQAIALKWDDGRVFVMGPQGEGLRSKSMKLIAERNSE
jgi:hypothetical protein